MSDAYKPDAYNDVSPYLVVSKADPLVDLLKHIFDAKILRKYHRPDGSVMHVEVKIGDSVVMIGESMDGYPPQPSMIHVYVPDAQAVYDRALTAGCSGIQEPIQKDADDDLRGGFADPEGNAWFVGTQIQQT